MFMTELGIINNTEKKENVLLKGAYLNIYFH